ncbi:hypothetical protein Pla175_52060 [Pirellulimonas nuda]|uniref:Squalene cyclase C-terminal domain-containing protein n=1 Tax=Pirellulimonas nuda TaxID=2528009 RepID=A0A518DJW5_9BACT|nr:hypothetical protein [Pirellulimonas nuda]QDU91775.1 hypothetical protein Pla175_52060 [Pirellulimonas nuda]
MLCQKLMRLSVVVWAALLLTPIAGAEEPTKNSPLATQGPKPEAIVPPSAAQVQSAIDRGVDFLLADQRPDGAWGSAENTKGLNIFAPVPGSHYAFQAAVSALALSALVNAEPTLTDERAERADAAIEKGQTWLLEHLDRVRRATPDALYNVWGHSYSLQGLADLRRRAEGKPELQATLLGAMQTQADMLARYEFVAGGWSYYDFDYGTQKPGDAPFSFTTATALVALKDAMGQGVEFPQKMIDRAIASIKRQRYPDFSYAYGEYLKMAPRYDINRPAGSLGRSQACNLALRRWGDPRVTDAVIETWLNRLFARNGWLGMGRKRPVPHESHFAVAGYFYYYGHYYAALSIEELPEQDRPYFQDHLANILLPLQEKDGSWWDYPFYNYHQQYGTAMAVTSLVKCQRNTPKPQ